MYRFLSNNRSDLISRCRIKVAQRPARHASQEQLQNGVPMFLDQLIETLRIEQTDAPLNSRRISGSAGAEVSFSAIGLSAARHGRKLLDLGFSISQVVHDYGDLCQAITDLAFERDAPFKVDEFRTLNRCLDNAIADAVTEFSYQRDSRSATRHTIETNDRMRSFSLTINALLQAASLSFTAARTGNLNLWGATGSMLDRSLTDLCDLIDQSLADTPLPADFETTSNVFSLADFISEINESAKLSAQAHGCDFRTSEVDTTLGVSANRNRLFSALKQLLRNAFKFTRQHSEVMLDAYAVGDRILIDVQDHCGGLSQDDIENMFQPYRRNGAHRNTSETGLSKARRSVQASTGFLSVRNITASGCVVTISLPRYPLPDA